MADSSGARNVADAIAEWAVRLPGAVALVENGRAIDYAGFDRAIWRAAWMFRHCGIGPGSIVGICLPNSALYLVVFHALARIGAIILPLPKSEPAAHRVALARRFAVTAIVGDTDGYDVRALQPDPAWLDGGSVVEDPGLRAAGGNAPLKIAFSSGTTGTPKAVMRTHHASMEIDRHRRLVVPQGAGDVFVALLEMGVSYGLRPCLRALEVGATVVLAPKEIGAADFAALAAHWRATHLALTPIHVSSLLSLVRESGPLLPHVRELIVSTANTPHALRGQIRQKLTPHLFISYGSNEVSVLALAGASLQDQFPDCVGRPMPGIEVEAVDEKDVPVTVGGLGMLRFRASWFPPGYIDDPQASARHFRGGWFYPGDVGMLADDTVIFLKGRVDEIINYDGVKIAPLDIENALLTHPAVIEAAAFPLHSVLHQQVPVAAVALRQPVEQASLLAFARARLGQRAPAYIMILNALPKNNMGKVIKRDLEQKVAAEIQRLRMLSGV